MARPRTIDPQEVVAGLRSGRFRFGADAAREFQCSRVRINQILAEHAPDLLPGKVKPLKPGEKKAISARQARMKRETEAALKKHATLAAAATALKLTESGLQSRMRRLGIERQDH